MPPKRIIRPSTESVSPPLKKRNIDFSAADDTSILNYLLSQLPENIRTKPRPVQLESIENLLTTSGGLDTTSTSTTTITTTVAAKEIPQREYTLVKTAQPYECTFFTLLYNCKHKCAIVDTGGIKVFNLTTNTLEASIACPNQIWVASLANDVLVSASSKIYSIWEIDWTEKTLQKLPLTPKAPTPQIFCDFHYSIADDGRKLLVQKDSQILVVWDVEREELKEIQTGFGTPTVCSYSRWLALPGSRVVVCNFGGRGETPPTIRLFDLTQTNLLKEIGTRHRIVGLDRHPDLVLALPNNCLFISYTYGSSNDTESFLINLDTNSVTEFLTGSGDSLLNGVLVSENQIVCVGQKGLVSVDLKNRKKVDWGFVKVEKEVPLIEVGEDGLLVCDVDGKIVFFK